MSAALLSPLPQPPARGFRGRCLSREQRRKRAPAERLACTAPVARGGPRHL